MLVRSGRGGLEAEAVEITGVLVGRLVADINEETGATGTCR